MTCVSDLVAQAITGLREGGVRFRAGLSDAEVTDVQERLGFVFGPEHRELIQRALPSGKRWPNWRHGSDAALRDAVDWPVEGVLFDVHNNGFWPASWGGRPDEHYQREHLARQHLALVPVLVPIYSHRYLPSDPGFSPSPVFSVHQSDVIFYGDDLLDYVAHEFFVGPRQPSERPHVPFWSDLALGAMNADL